MEKVIAKLEVVVMNQERATNMHRLSETEWRLEINPEFDQRILNSIGTGKKERDEVESIVAHELGHFVRDLGLSYVEQGAKYFVERMTGTKAVEEQRAWELGEEMYPELDKDLARQAVSDYRSGKSREV